MIITLILALAALVALLSSVRLTKGRALTPEVLENPAKHIRAVDVEAFRNLVDPDEEEFLRTNLPPAEFRRIQRERLRAAVEYVSCAAQNAAILLRVADAGRRSPIPQPPKPLKSWWITRFVFGFMLRLPSPDFIWAWFCPALTSLQLASPKATSR